MKNKKYFQNLLESIIMLVALFFSAFIYVCMIYYGVLHPREGTDPFATLIAGTLIFGSMIVMASITIIIWCFGYWTINDDEIYSKKLFRKPVRIKFDNIVSVERKIVPYFLFSNYQDEAYIISDKNYKIVILIKVNNVFTLKFLEEYMNNDSHF